MVVSIDLNMPEVQERHFCKGIPLPKLALITDVTNISIPSFNLIII